MAKTQEQEKGQVVEMKTKEVRTLPQKLLAIRKAASYIKKEFHGDAGEFAYVSSSQVLYALREKMDEEAVLLTTNILDRKTHFNGQYATTELDIEFCWVNAENAAEEPIKLRWYSLGVGNESAVGKALTYAEKFFLLKQFNIPTDEMDPDAFQKKREQEAPPALIGEIQARNLQAIAEEIADIQGETPDAYLQHLGFKAFSRIPMKEYGNIKKKLDGWLKKALEKKEAEKPAEEKQPVAHKQETPQSPSATQGTETKQEKSNDKKPADQPKQEEPKAEEPAEQPKREDTQPSSDRGENDQESNPETQQNSEIAVTVVDHKDSKDKQGKEIGLTRFQIVGSNDVYYFVSKDEPYRTLVEYIEQGGTAPLMITGVKHNEQLYLLTSLRLAEEGEA